MKHLTMLLAVAVLTTCTAVADTLIHAGRLIDGESDRATTEKTIRIVGGDIMAIENGYGSHLHGRSISTIFTPFGSAGAV